MSLDKLRNKTVRSVIEAGFKKHERKIYQKQLFWDKLEDKLIFHKFIIVLSPNSGRKYIEKPWEKVLREAAV